MTTIAPTYERSAKVQSLPKASATARAQGFEPFALTRVPEGSSARATRVPARPRKLGRTLQLPSPGRRAAGVVHDLPDLAQLLERRRALLQQEALSPAEQRELALLEWKLERVEEQELGPDLERLEALAALGRRFAQHVQDLHEQLGQRLLQQRPDRPWQRRR